MQKLVFSSQSVYVETVSGERAWTSSKSIAQPSSIKLKDFQRFYDVQNALIKWRIYINYFAMKNNLFFVTPPTSASIAQFVEPYPTKIRLRYKKKFKVLLTNGHFQWCTDSIPKFFADFWNLTGIICYFRVIQSCIQILVVIRWGRDTIAIRTSRVRISRCFKHLL